MVFDKSSYENVVCLGHILAEDGRKMSKHLGNILAPILLMDAHGADALRWFMACSGSPWSPRRVGLTAIGRDHPQDPADVLEHGVVLQPVREPHLQWDPAAADPPAGRPILDPLDPGRGELA